MPDITPRMTLLSSQDISVASWNSMNPAPQAEGVSLKMANVPVWFHLFVPCAMTHFHLSQQSESYPCADGCGTSNTCHIRIHRTLPNTEVCEQEQRWALCLYVHQDDIMGGVTVIRTALLWIKVHFSKPFENLPINLTKTIIPIM